MDKMNAIRDHLDNLNDGHTINKELDVLELTNENKVQRFSAAEIVDMKQRLRTYQNLVYPINKEIVNIQVQIWSEEQRLKLEKECKGVNSR